VIRPLAQDDVPGCADLLVRRHAAHLERQPFLAPLHVQRARELVAELLGTEGSGGWVAEAGGEVVGYLLAVPHQARYFGECAWVHPHGWAGDRLPELYAEAAAVWKEQGRLGHYVLAPATQVEPWFHLGFGVQHVHAAMPATSRPVPGWVRRATRDDIPVLARLDTVLDETVRASPVFSVLPETTYEESLADWEEGFDDEHVVFVADPDGQVLGCSIGVDVSKSSSNKGLIVPERAGFLGFAAVLPEGRGRGLGRALGDAVTDWVAGEGYPTVCSDWRSANLTAARTWTALGYQETYLRLHRQLAA
jgi:GNAT superfamily N-acetyltransferase